MILARAPLRVSLGGGGTDLPSYYSLHGGFILGAAIDKYIYLYVNRPAADDLIRVKYSQYEEAVSAADVKHDLVRPLLQLLQIDSNIEIASMADVPAGTGLGSSSTYVVALLVALHEHLRRPLPPQALAELAGHVEIDLAGHPVGKQDHYMAAFGGLTCIDISTDGTTHVTPLNISISDTEKLEARLLLFFTGLSRSANSILSAQQGDTESGNVEVLESLHKTKALGMQIKAALEQGHLDEFGLMMHEHWQTKKRRSVQISDLQVDEWYEAARAAGALGGKIVGAGGGGFLMLYCPDEAREAVRFALSSQGLKEMPFRLEFQGAKTVVNL